MSGSEALDSATAEDLSARGSRLRRPRDFPFLLFHRLVNFSVQELVGHTLTAHWLYRTGSSAPLVKIAFDLQVRQRLLQPSGTARPKRIC